MPTHIQVVPCREKQTIAKCVKKVTCVQGKPKKKQIREVPCPAAERQKPRGRVEEVPCPEMERGRTGGHHVSCPGKSRETCHTQKTVPCCPAGEQKRSPKGCPKCEYDRMEKLEWEVYQLRREIECMKEDRKSAEKAVEKAIIRGARALGGKFKRVVPESIEKLLDSCDSDGSSVSRSFKFCSNRARSDPAAGQFCVNKPAKKKKFDYCK